MRNQPEADVNVAASWSPCVVTLGVSVLSSKRGGNCVQRGPACGGRSMGGRREGAPGFQLSAWHILSALAQLQQSILRSETGSVISRFSKVSLQEAMKQLLGKNFQTERTLPSPVSKMVLEQEVGLSSFSGTLLCPKLGWSF